MSDIFRLTDVLERLEREGVELPNDFHAISAAYEAATVDRVEAARIGLINAIAAGDDAAADAAAYDLAAFDSPATVRGTADGAWVAAVRAMPVEPLYRQLADKYDEAADKLTAALAQCDADAEPPMQATAKVRTAWQEAPALAAEVDRLADLLAAVVRDLKGVTHFKSRQPQSMVPLTVHTGQTNPRRVCEAWEQTDSRAGRWPGIIAAGGKLQAPPTLADYKRLELPAVVRVGDALLDPLDPADAERLAQIDESRRRRGLSFGRAR